MTTNYTKDPQAKLDYGWDWSAWLGTDTISTSTWTVDPAGPVLSNATHDGTKTTVWIAGGVSGSTYTLTNHVLTNSTPAREDDRSFKLKVKER